MLFYWIILAICVAAAAQAAAIVVPKFPQLSLIDTASLPKEREAKKKQDIIRSRVHAGTKDWWKRVAARISPAFWRIRTSYRKAFGRVLRLDYKYRRARPKRLHPEKASRKVEALMADGRAHIDAGRYHEAERALLHVLRLEPRNIDAYGSLADAYMQDRQYARAKETVGFLLRMRMEGADGRSPEGAELAAMAKDHVRYGLACQQLGEPGSALESYEMAVSLEPSNPKYLDLLLEACILEGDQIRAREVLEKLRTADPMNQKLGQLEQRIAAIG